MLLGTLCDPNFCGCIVIDTEFLGDQDFLRLRLETLQFTLRFMCPSVKYFSWYIPFLYY